MIAQPYRRALVAVPPAFVPPLGALLRPAFATVLTIVVTDRAMVARLAVFGRTLALRSLGPLSALFASMAAVLMVAFRALRAIAALVGAPRTTFRAMTAPFRAISVLVCVLLALASVLDAL